MPKRRRTPRKVRYYRAILRMRGVCFKQAQRGTDFEWFIGYCRKCGAEVGIEQVPDSNMVEVDLYGHKLEHGEDQCWKATCGRRQNQRPR